MIWNFETNLIYLKLKKITESVQLKDVQGEATLGMTRLC
jgi:hypothetical protein